MMKTRLSSGVPIKFWTNPDTMESKAWDQVYNVACLPEVFSHVAIMADAHYGKGATVGSVIAMRGAVSPASVGVDLGCGMLALRTDLTSHSLPESLKDLSHLVEARIPVGFRSHESSHPVAADIMTGFENLSDAVQDLGDKATKQIGTLGGGNHFVEVCLDTRDRVWILLHSGSRHIGKVLADIHISRAKTLMHNVGLRDMDLATLHFGTEEFEAYRRDLYWAQNYAWKNREVMMGQCIDVLRTLYPDMRVMDEVACHHNYVAEESHYGEQVLVTRKGAISARAGERGIIPGSMGTGSYIVRGLGNPESFCSAAHGAGRQMSRKQAKKRFSTEDLRNQTEGVYCRKDDGVLDEIPGAYKNIDEVMENQKDLVSVEEKLKQILCIKG